MRKSFTFAFLYFFLYYKNGQKEAFSLKTSFTKNDLNYCKFKNIIEMAVNDVYIIVTNV